MLTHKQKELIQTLDIVKTSVSSRTRYNAYHQMLTRIRRLGRAAIEDLLYLSRELPENEIKRVLTDSQTENLIRIVEKALKASRKIPQDSTLSLRINAELAVDHSKQSSRRAMPFRYETFVSPKTGTVFKHGVYEEEAQRKPSQRARKPGEIRIDR